MKNIYSIILMALCFIVSIDAAAAYRSVIVQRRDGSQVKIGVQAGMTAAMADGLLKFTSSKGEISLPVEEVGHWKFSTAAAPEDLWTGIDATVADDVAVDYSGDIITIAGLAAGSDVSLYSLDGRLTARGAYDGLRYTVSTAGLAPAVYILVFGNHQFKLKLD